MSCTATNPTVTVAAQVPDGIYGGIWGGYVVRFTIAGQTIEAKTSLGIRTTAAPCVVRVDGGVMTVETK